MELIIIILTALLGSCLSFFCGFGLGTLLLPAFLLFFPLPVAIAATAVVHMLNNVFKLFLVGRYASWSVLKYFGLLSVAGALLGAFSLKWLGDIEVLASYQLGNRVCEITAVKVLVAIVIIGFSFIEILPRFKEARISKRLLPIGGLLSGYFGGLSGHQGALRSAFLVKAGLSKEAFLGTRVMCAILVDTTRISVYATEIKSGWQEINPYIVGSAALAAFTGAWLGNKWVKKIELQTLNVIITIALIVFGLALGTGLV